MKSRMTEMAERASTLVELLRCRAEQSPERRAFTFLAGGEEETASLTYGELDRKARAVGAMLQKHSSQGDRAILIYPTGLDFIAAFFGCLYAGVIAVPVNPPRFNHNNSRLAAIVKDCQPTLALTTSGLIARGIDSSMEDEGLGGLCWKATDELPFDGAEAWQETSVGAEALAFIQYTSGSTSVPKGVMVSHYNVLQNSAFINYGAEVSPETISLTWLPHFHDMGLIDGIIQPLFSGYPCIVMPPAAFLQRPARWLNAISRYRVTHTGGPNFAYDLCVKRVKPEQCESLDLSSWAVAYNGAEPVRKRTLEQFASTFKASGFRLSTFYPAYGLAESTLKVAGGLRSEEPVYCTVDAGALEGNRVVEVPADAPGSRAFVGSGKSALGTTIVIVDAATGKRCAPDEVGEIWVSGTSVAQGYWGRVEETMRTFRAYLADSGAGPFLRTGDLGFIKDEQLFITGRLKDLIIIDGQNHYPQDMELTVEQSHTAIRPGCCAAFAIEEDGEERVIIVAELERTQRHADPYEVDRAVRQAVAENHDLRVHSVLFIRTGAIPKTSSGKIQRHLCQAEYLAGRMGN